VAAIRAFQVDAPAFGAGPSRRNKADAEGRVIARQGKYPLAGLHATDTARPVKITRTAGTFCDVRLFHAASYGGNKMILAEEFFCGFWACHFQ
jgi:hypothetical protein